MAYFTDDEMDEAIKASPTGKVMNMDGMLHFVGDPKCCRSGGSLKDDCECGGIIHHQGIWGGLMNKCDKCGRIY